MCKWSDIKDPSHLRSHDKQAILHALCFPVLCHQSIVHTLLRRVDDISGISILYVLARSL
jgi:hypothetical protein